MCVVYLASLPPTPCQGSCSELPKNGEEWHHIRNGHLPPLDHCTTSFNSLLLVYNIINLPQTEAPSKEPESMWHLNILHNNIVCISQKQIHVTVVKLHVTVLKLHVTGKTTCITVRMFLHVYLRHSMCCVNMYCLLSVLFNYLSDLF